MPVSRLPRPSLPRVPLPRVPLPRMRKAPSCVLFALLAVIVPHPQAMAQARAANETGAGGVGAGGVGAGGVGAGAQSDGALCLAAIAVAERAARLPALLLGSIGVVESGRADPRTARVVPWPWSINVAGVDHVFETKAEAIAAVRAARAAGVQSIDAGCLQVNLMYHPTAFASLEEAFDPQANATYAATFLSRLYAQTGGWPQATAAYHSQTVELGAVYARRVMAIWPMAGRYGAAPSPATTAAPPAAPATDPYRVLTPEFRGRLLRDAAADQAARVAMGVAPARRSALPRPPPLGPLGGLTAAPRLPAVRAASLRTGPTSAGRHG